MTLEARIVDTGLRPYDGVRGGQAAAVRSVALHSIRRALGLRRPARAKVLPVLVAAIAFIPAVVMVGIVASVQVELSRVLPSYADYYGFIDIAVIAFTAVVVPEVLCPDRRSGMLRVYLAAPLDGPTYVLSKVTAVAATLLVVTLGPTLFLLAGLSLAGSGPGGPLDVTITVLRILAASTAMSAVYGTVALAAAAMTDRRAVASTTIVLLLLVPGIAVSVLVQNLHTSDWLYCADLGQLVPILVDRVFGRPGAHPHVPAAVAAGAAALWIAVAAIVLVVRHRDAGRRR